jgi:hypothetical protein
MECKNRRVPVSWTEEFLFIASYSHTICDLIIILNVIEIPTVLVNFYN